MPPDIHNPKPKKNSVSSGQSDPLCEAKPESSRDQACASTGQHFLEHLVVHFHAVGHAR